MRTLAESHVMALEPYVAGRPIENDTKIASWAKLGSNENCLGPSPLALLAIKKVLSKAHLYPNATRVSVINKICDHLRDFSIKQENVALGNGTSELIVNLVRGLLASDEALLYVRPTFVMYRLAALAHGRTAVAIPTKPDMTTDVELMTEAAHNRSKNPVKLVFLANPNNPTGEYLNKNQLDDFVRSLPKDVVLVIDEAYFEYVMKEDYPNGLIYALSRPRTLVLRTFSKVYGLAGIRMGYAVGDPQIIDILCRIRDPFNVNTMAQHAAIAALDDVAHIKKSVDHNLKYKPELVRGLRQFGLVVHDGVGNFVMAKKAPFMRDTHDLCNRLIELGVIIRPLSSFGLSDWVRISVGTKAEIDQLLKAMESVFP